MNYIQISIEATEQQQEELIGILSALDATGFEQVENCLLAYFDEQGFESYKIKETLKTFPFQLTTIREQNWNKVWESNFQPVLVGDFCAIRADFHDPLPAVQHEIIITPKMSFGTGHHATTYMMIEQMRDIDFKSKTAFDFGTGTGILAILAEKLGAANVVAIDTDDWSITNAQENINANNCRKIIVNKTSLVPQQEFDIVLANINKNVLLQYASALKNCVAADGYLLLSGLLETDEKHIVELYAAQGYVLFKKTARNTWISLLFNNRRAH